MPDVFAIQEIRKHIFEYLRSHAYSTCATCTRVVQWDEYGKLNVSTMTYGGITECKDCFLEKELMRNTYASSFL